MGGGTEAFEDLGRHCEQEDCHQLDFLPFKCDGCLKVFCVEHRTYKAHACPKADHKSRVVVVCEACSAAIEKKEGSEPDGDTLRRHAQSGDCDPAKKRKPRCPVKGCREQLTFSNTSNCRSCFCGKDGRWELQQGEAPEDTITSANRSLLTITHNIGRVEPLVVSFVLWVILMSPNFE